jgi:hypothetical protein
MRVWPPDLETAMPLPDDAPALSIRHRASLAGIVRFKDRKGAAGIRVTLQAADVSKLADDPAFAPRSTVTNADGSFRFIDLAAADYALTTRTPLEIRQRPAVAAAVTPVTIPIDRKAAPGEPVLPVFVTIALESDS